MSAVARPVSDSTNVRLHVESIRRIMSLQSGFWTPAPRHSWIYCVEGLTVRFHGESLGGGPVADYVGPLGEWQANLNPHGVGKPRRVS